MGKASNSKKTRADKIAATGYGKKGINWFPIISTAFAVVAIVAVLIVTVFANQRALEPSVAPTSNVTLPADIATTINQDTGAVTIGTADNKMEEYIDFGCPYCGDYHRNHGEDVRGFVADGKIALSIFPLALLDRAFQGTEFSTRAANSFYCVAEKAPNSVLDYVANLYANQPKEGTKGLTDDEIVKIAANSGAADAESCIREQTYKDFVTQTTRKANANDWLTGTPTIRLNDKIVDYNRIVDELKAL